MRLPIYLLLAYLIGSIPTAYIVGKVLKGIDIRKHGSKNVGATNAFRVLGPPIGIAVLVIDILKGLIAVKLASLFGGEHLYPVLGGMASICGHNWTVFLSFKGGKGVATSTGVFLALVPRSLLLAFIVFVIVVAITRFISAGSITASIVLALAVTLQFVLKIGDAPSFPVLLLAWLAGGFVVWRHKANIQRLIKGEENRFSFRRS